MSIFVDNFGSMSDDVLESEIRGLSARVAATMCRFLLAVAEYDRRRGWERWECRDMAAWLSWKCGISQVTAREYCRVAAALLRLPRVRARFASGQLSFTQVRAICRAATPATERSLVELAEVSTGAQLERITRAYRRAGRVGDDDAGRRHASRYLRFTYDDEGCLVGSFRVPAEAGAVLAAAIAAAVDPESVRQAGDERAHDPFSAVQADVLVGLVAAGHGARAEGPDDDDEGDDRYLVTIVTERRVLAGGPAPGSGGECHIEDGPGLAAETARRIACDSTVVEITETPDGTILDVGRRTRVIGRRMRRALRRRDTHCRYPGCTGKVVQGHHIRHWADGGPTRLDNLVSLCPRHHHRLHEGGYSIRRDPCGRIEFVHRGGWTIPEVCPAPDQLESRIGWEEPAPYQDGWDGTRLDLSTVVEDLLLTDHYSSMSGHGPESADDSAVSART